MELSASSLNIGSSPSSLFVQLILKVMDLMKLTVLLPCEVLFNVLKMKTALKVQ